MQKTYVVKAKLWLYPSKAGSWHFVTLPKKTTKDINFYFAHRKRGWGSLPVVVTLGKTNWKTSIFPDKKEGSYILPLKADVRKSEGVKKGDMVPFSMEINV